MIVDQLKKFEEIGFTLEATGDGSPTLRLKTASLMDRPGEIINRPGESMHHSAGAFSETCYIYGPLLHWGLKNHGACTVLSIGLGLGYVEILTATLASRLKHSQWLMASFEIVEGLRNSFVESLQNKNDFENSIYGDIAGRFGGQLGIPIEDIRSQLAKALNEDRLQIKGDLLASPLEKSRYHVVCQDAFSRKTNPNLWEELFLAHLLQAIHSPGVLGTYASLGPLKRALRAQDFQMLIRDGFHGKRNCTMAGLGLSSESILQDLPENLRSLWRIS